MSYQRINVRVIPRASKNEVSGDMGNGLKVRLTSAPVDGKANAALIDILTDYLTGLLGYKVRVEIVKGHTGKAKIISVIKR